MYAQASNLLLLGLGGTQPLLRATVGFWRGAIGSEDAGALLRTTAADAPGAAAPSAYGGGGALTAPAALATMVTLFACEHALLAAQWSLLAGVPDVPADVSIERERQAWRARATLAAYAGRPLPTSSEWDDRAIPQRFWGAAAAKGAAAATAGGGGAAAGAASSRHMV